tara:strand:- start:101 stop:487 length:387 start_codon:yes stop_codon:yes gene_type:complete
MIGMLSIADVSKIDDRRKQIRKEIYTKIYDQFVSKIKQAVELGCKQIFLSVPSFVVGYPTFDRNQAAKYIARQFLRGGFSVQMITPVELYVTWYAPRRKRERKEEEEEVEFPTLMNLKKIANKYRGNA